VKEGGDKKTYTQKHEWKWALDSGMKSFDALDEAFTDQRPKEGDTVGLKINDNGNLVFFLNDQNLGAAFSGHKPDHPIFPFIQIRETGD
jgi:hypothetical protein